MFPKTKNIEDSFRYVRVMSLAVVIGCFCTSIVAFVVARRLVEKAQSRVYVLSAGKVFEAFGSDRRANLEVEARAQVYDFLEAFFTLDPDEKYVRETLRHALYLADASARRVYDNLVESGYYAGIVSANITQRISIDSIALDTQSVPYSFRCYATETITRETSIVTRSLVTEGSLRVINRSQNNPHGFLIERWTILENKDLKVEQR